MDWQDYITLGTAVAPALLNRGGATPFDSPELQQALHLQNQRLQQAGPAFASAVNMARGMTPVRYRTGDMPNFAAGPAGAAAVPRSGMAPPAPSPSSGGGSHTPWGAVAGIASKVLPFLKGGKPKGKDLHNGPQGPDVDASDLDARAAALKDSLPADAPHTPRPSVTTDTTFGLPPTIALGEGRSATLVRGTQLYQDEHGQYYDVYGNPVDVPDFVGDIYPSTGTEHA